MHGLVFFGTQGFTLCDVPLCDVQLGKQAVCPSSRPVLIPLGHAEHGDAPGLTADALVYWPAGHSRHAVSAETNSIVSGQRLHWYSRATWPTVIIPGVR